MLKAVIFDLDGVLVDSQPFHFGVDVKVLESCGLNHDKISVERYAGIATKDRMLMYLRDYELEMDIMSILSLYNSVFSDCFIETEMFPIAGVVDLISLLDSSGIKIAVASSSSLDFINKTLVKLGLINYFKIIVSGETVARGKPFPDIFLKAANEIGVLSDFCVVIEDSANGVIAAKNAGLKCIGYRNPTSGIQDLSEADVIIDNFYTLTKKLDWLTDIKCLN